jgi:hypothetical protein
MLGLSFQSDVSTLEAAIGMLIKQLSRQAAALSSEDHPFRSHKERSRNNRERNPKVYSTDSSPVRQHSDGPWFERSIRELGLRSQHQHRRGRGRSILAEGSISLFGGFAGPPSDEQKRAITDQLTAGIAAAGGAAGFDVDGAEA